MIEIHARFGQAPHYDLNMLGRAGEHGTRQIVFDCADALREYPNARIICAVLRPRDTTPYPAELTAIGDTRILTLTRTETYLPGLLKLELRAVDGERVLKSALYVGRITESLQGENDEPGNPISDVLNRLDTTIEQAKSATENAQNAAESVKGYALAETARVEAEEARVSGEAARVSAESDRVIAENERVTAEQARAAAESNRVATEETRQAALTAAVTSASGSAESAGKSATAAAASATAAQEAREAIDGFAEIVATEPTAQDILAAIQSATTDLKKIAQDGNETIREANEEARIAAEAERVANESARKSAETKRIEDEAERVSKENSRISAETARDTAEGTRASNETARVNAESDREIAETARSQAEQARAAAESNRVATENIRQAALTSAVNSATTSATSAEGSASAASSSASAAQEAQEAVEGFVQSIAKEPTAQQILAVMQQELTLLNQLVENGMGGSGSLNGFSFSRGENDELIISYVNPDDETDTATSTFATKTLANLIAQELASINESLHTIAGMEQTAQTEG